MTAALVVVGAALTMTAGCSAVATDDLRGTSPSTPRPTTSQELSMQTFAPPAGASAATRALFTAVEASDLVGIKDAIADGADLEARGPLGRTPLVEATKANRSDVATTLLEAGADPNAKDDIQDSAFLYAGAEGLDEIVRATLAHGADVRSTNRYGGTALIPASEHAHVPTVRMLIAAGVPVNHVNNLSWTALHEAIVLGNGDAEHVEVVRLLLKAGADQSIADGDGVLPRTLARQRGFSEIVDELDRANER
ncbi:ankyrin repeat domain-containing protein [Humibacter ginsenosidimutans]|uniref:ankyrin repeat domain-containing protein n=1 Tax=Humibacter ginsenosidimutans TaxID=2599293 RepID=UPI001FEE757F|nr:ankyrin repeat domain-containing protein [Humibacter ginsenosidimutans]